MKMTGKNRKNLRLRLAAAALAFSMFGNAGLAFAAPRVPEDMSQARYDSLQDDLIEWDELSDLVTYYSPLFAGMKEISQDSSVGELEKVRDAWQSELDDAKREEENLKDELADATDPMQKAELAYAYAYAKAVRTGYQQARAGYGKAVRTAQKKLDASFEAQKPALVYGVEQIFLGAKQLEQALAIQKKQVEVYQAAYSAQATAVQNGLATQAELLAAQYSLESAKQQLSVTQEQFDSLKRSLGILLGWSAEDAEKLRFGALPDYALDYLDGRDFEADLETAKMSNKTLGAARREQANSSSARRAKEANLADEEAKLRMEMEALQQKVREERALYDAAKSGLEAARISRDAAERKKALGLVGNAAYEALALQYIAQEAQANIAQMGYVSAVFAYEWALKGQM